MNRDEAREAAAILMAYAEGKVIEERDRRGSEEYMPEWCPYPTGAHPLFNFECYEYRIKPEPREWWINPENSWLLQEHEKPFRTDEGWIKVCEVIDD